MGVDYIVFGFASKAIKKKVMTGFVYDHGRSLSQQVGVSVDYIMFGFALELI